MTTYGERCREKREARGLSLSGARDALLFTIPRRYVPSIKTLHRMEQGEIAEEKADGIVLYGLAKVYGCNVRDLSELAADELEGVRDLLATKFGWIATDPIPGQGTLSFPAPLAA